ncbi:hypothetical protein Hypma_009309 [Hypsizygus marmoreus]|uniref:Uncharacterized protein n=1 Tax=Hypsizygus marmoreus TaxID=39966 RepID=A0A369JPE7_HYPMA|nr:hypothetical protein Hypma_009309 [Hypsizygus marmoreus]
MLLLPSLAILYGFGLLSITFLAPWHGPGPPFGVAMIGAAGVSVTAVTLIVYRSQRSIVVPAKPEHKPAPKVAWLNATSIVHHPLPLADRRLRPQDVFATPLVYSLTVLKPSASPSLTQSPFWTSPKPRVPPTTTPPTASLGIYCPPQAPALTFSPFWAIPDLLSPLISRFQPSASSGMEEKEEAVLVTRPFLPTCSMGDRPAPPICWAATNVTIENFNAPSTAPLDRHTCILGDVPALLTCSAAATTNTTVLEVVNAPLLVHFDALAFFSLPTLPTLPAFPPLPPFPALSMFGTHPVPAFAPATKGNATIPGIPGPFIGPIDTRPIIRPTPPVKKSPWAGYSEGRFWARQMAAMAVMILGSVFWKEPRPPNIQLPPAAVPNNEPLPMLHADPVPEVAVEVEVEVGGGVHPEPVVPEIIPPRVFPAHMGRAKVVAGRRTNPRTLPRTPPRSASRLAEMKTGPSTV